MVKVCIICRKQKDKYNVEHVIPSAIGGTIEIQSVCRDCNSILGKTIDEPFLKTPWVGLYRKEWNLKRTDTSHKNMNRAIANPLKRAMLEGDNANDYFINYTKDNIPYAKRKTVTSIERTIDGFKGHIVTSKEGSEKVIAGFLKKHGIDKNAIEYVTEEIPGPQLSFIVTSPTAPVLLESLKIAYEFAVTTIPTYFQDEWALLFSKYLNGREQADLIMARLTSVANMMDKFHAEIELLKKLPLYIHFVMLRQFEGIGLVAITKMFDAVIVTHLSNRYYMSRHDKQIGVLINCLERKHSFLVEVNWQNVNLNLDLSSLNIIEEASIRESLAQNSDNIMIDGNIPIYDEGKEVILQDIAQLPTITESSLVYDFDNNIATAEVNNFSKRLFVKHEAYNAWLPLSACQIRYSIVR